MAYTVTSIRLQIALHKDIKMACAQTGISMSGIAVSAWERFTNLASNNIPDIELGMINKDYVMNVLEARKQAESEGIDWKKDLKLYSDYANRLIYGDQAKKDIVANGEAKQNSFLVRSQKQLGLDEDRGQAKLERLKEEAEAKEQLRIARENKKGEAEQARLDKEQAKAEKLAKESARANSVYMVDRIYKDPPKKYKNPRKIGSREEIKEIISTKFPKGQLYAGRIDWITIDQYEQLGIDDDKYLLIDRACNVFTLDGAHWDYATGAGIILANKIDELFVSQALSGIDANKDGEILYNRGGLEKWTVTLEMLSDEEEFDIGGLQGLLRMQERKYSKAIAALEESLGVDWDKLVAREIGKLTSPLKEAISTAIQDSLEQDEQDEHAAR